MQMSYAKRRLGVFILVNAVKGLRGFVNMQTELHNDSCSFSCAPPPQLPPSYFPMFAPALMNALSPSPKNQAQITSCIKMML